MSTSSSTSMSVSIAAFSRGQERVLALISILIAFQTWQSCSSCLICSIKERGAVDFSFMLVNKLKFQFYNFYFRISLKSQPRTHPTSFLFLLLFINMQGNKPTNLLRNSYGFQKTQTLLLTSANGKGFPMPQNPNASKNTGQSVSNSIRMQEAMIEGYQSRVKKKTSQESAGGSSLPNNFLKPQQVEGKCRATFPMPHLQQPLSNEVLRGSCQNILKKFDYSNLRNTTNFNVTEKRNTQHQLRRSPKEDYRDPTKKMQINKTHTQEFKPSFLKVEKTMEGKKSHVSPCRTPPKQYERQTTGAGRTPVKYKTATETTKTSILSKGSPQIEGKKFKSLNQIVQQKNRQKIAQQVKGYKRSKILNGFEFGRTLGKGKFGEVFLARHQACGFIAAIKKIEKKTVVEYKMVDQFVKEIRLHASLDHPNIVKFYGVFEQKDHIYLVMEYMNGGTLFDYLNEVPHLQVPVAAIYLKDIIEALSYMHGKSIAHRDIKPENIVINSEGVAKLCDFGWSALVESSRKTYCGTFQYAPPELLQRKNYDASVDIWCIGVLTYELLTGRVPFEGEKRVQIMQKIVNVDKKKIDYPVQIPAEAREFIEALVQKDPSNRPRCSQLLKYRFFSNFLPKGKSKKLQ